MATKSAGLCYRLTTTNLSFLLLLKRRGEGEIGMRNPKYGLGFPAIALCVVGCVAQTPTTPEPPATKIPVSSATVVPVSAVVNQLKCDVGAFLKSQDAHPGVFTVYDVAGTLTFSLERTMANGWSVAVAPSFPVLAFGPGLSANVGRSQSTTHDVGDDVIMKFDMQAQPDPSDDPHAQTAVDQGACEHGLGAAGHIIEPEALRQQVEGIIAGAPKIGFSTVEYKGKFVLKHSDDAKASISLYIVSASLPTNMQDSSYTQQFDITLNLEPPVTTLLGSRLATSSKDTAVASAPLVHHMTAHRSRAAPPPPQTYAAAPEATAPQVGSSGTPEDNPPGGLSEHLKRLTDAIPEADPH